MGAAPGEPHPPPLPRPTSGADWPERWQLARERLIDALDANPSRARMAGLAALVGAVVLAFFILRSGGGPPPLEDSLPTLEPTAVATPAAPRSALVHVAGAVARPGLAELPADARVADAIDAVGGPDQDADLDRVNLAAPVADGQRIVVPRVGQDPPALVAPADGDEAVGSGPLDINAATAAQLETLPGVGPATAAAIVAHREDNGPFATVAALDEVPGIGPAKLAQLRDLVTVGP